MPSDINTKISFIDQANILGDISKIPKDVSNMFKTTLKNLTAEFNRAQEEIEKKSSDLSKEQKIEEIANLKAEYTQKKELLDKSYAEQLKYLVDVQDRELDAYSTIDKFRNTLDRDFALRRMSQEAALQKQQIARSIDLKAVEMQNQKELDDYRTDTIIQERTAALQLEITKRDNAYKLGNLEKQIAVDKLKAETDYQKRVIKDNVDFKTLRLQAQKELVELETSTQLEALSAEEELNKTKRENENKLHKSQILHATKLGSAIAANGKSYAENMLSAASSVISTLTTGAEKYMDVYASYMGRMEARLQESGVNFSKLTKQLRTNTAANPYLQYNKVLEKLSSLVEAGITDNVLQRAFLDEIADKIATTFSATQASLLQIGRLQQADTTASRLGLEANLTRLFNYYFGDTSYLSNQFDAVQETLIGVSAQLGAQSSIEFEYTVQKWLGALSSVGASPETISKIAQGIEYLGTANISALTSDESLKNLFTVAMQRSNISYGTAMERPLSASETNTLMYNLIRYIQELSSTDNNLVKAKYAELFGVSLSDMVAFGNLGSTIDSLYSLGMTYADTIDELNNQLDQVSKRTHISEMIQNVMENTLAGIGTTIADNAALYATYKAADIIESITGGIYLPTISALGSSIDLNMSIEKIAKTGIIGASAMSQLIEAVRSLTRGGGLNLSNWTVDSSKGQGFMGYRSNQKLIETSSSVSYVSSGSTIGTQESLVEQQRSAGTVVSGQELTEANELATAVKLIVSILRNEKDPIRVDINNPEAFSGISASADIVQLGGSTI